MFRKRGNGTGERGSCRASLSSRMDQIVIEALITIDNTPVDLVGLPGAQLQYSAAFILLPMFLTTLKVFP